MAAVDARAALRPVLGRASPAARHLGRRASGGGDGRWDGGPGYLQQGRRLWRLHGQCYGRSSQRVGRPRSVWASSGSTAPLRWCPRHGRVRRCGCSGGRLRVGRPGFGGSSSCSSSVVQARSRPGEPEWSSCLLWW
jgi:hypothetical protein